MSDALVVGSGPVSALADAHSWREVAAGSAPSGDGGAWAVLAFVLCEEIGRLREHIEDQLGQPLPFPPVEVISALRALHGMGDPRLASVIERLVDL